MKTRKRLLSVLLALCMVFGLSAGMTVTAFAESITYPAYVKAGGETIGLGGQNKAGTARYSDGVLTLENYSGGGISASGGDLTIRVIGDNYIVEPGNWGIHYQNGQLTIDGENTGKLTIHSSNTALLVYAGGLRVQNLVEFNCTSTITEGCVIRTMRAPNTTVEFSGIGTMFVRAKTGTGYSLIFSDQPMKFDSIGTLVAINGNNEGITAHGGLEMTNCGTIIAISENKEGIYGYSKNVTIEADRLLAAGRYGVYQYFNESTMDLSGVHSMLLEGQWEATGKSRATVVLPNGALTSDDRKTVSLNPGALTQITLSDTTQFYDGQPIEVTASAQSGSEPMTYIYSWYDATGTPLMGAPTDAGTYTVRVYGFSDSYYADFVNPATETVTILPANKPDETFYGTVGKGNNVYNLPALPAGMHYGMPEVDISNLTASETITAGIGGSKLSIQTSGLEDGKTYFVKIPVEREEGANGNYNNYYMNCTLTAQISYPRFDLCDGTPVIENGDQAPTAAEIDGAWSLDKETATEFGYTFAGWHTAPNGWGDMIADANGDLLDGYEFTDGTTYFAHWVATKAVAGYIMTENGSELVYAQFANAPRTVYTTGLDFTKSTLPNVGNGYIWDSEQTTLTLSGVLINAGKDSPALILPEGTIINLDNDYRLSEATEYYIYRNGISEKLPEGTVPAEKASAYNNVTGGNADIPSLKAKGDLTINTLNDCTLSMRRGAVQIAGSLYMDSAIFSAPGITVNKAAVLTNGAMIISEDVDNPDGGGMDFSVSSLDVGNNSGVMVGGDLSAEANIELGETTLLMVNGCVRAENLIAGKISGMSYCYGLQCEGSITLGNTDLLVTGDTNLVAVYAPVLTVEDGSVLTIRDYPLCGIVSNQMTVRNSTVKIQNPAGAQGGEVALVLASPDPQLTLEHARITAPFGATLVENESIGLVVMDGDNAAMELTIEPYDIQGGTGYVIGNTVTVGKTEHGTITATPRTASSGTIITISAVPDAGYILDSLTATDANGKQLPLTPAADGKYTCVMPSSSVTINGTFRFRFDDVDLNAWYFGGVAYCLENGLMDGVNQTSFAPNGTLTRAQLVTILWRLEKQPGVNYTMSFADVPENMWYTEAVRWAASEKLVDGVSESSFAPEAQLTREQLVAILWRYCKYKGYDVSVGEDTNILSYDDAFDVADYATAAMQWACGTGLINGSDGKLLPKDTTSRAQIAVILQRFCTLEK